jgi:Carboxypeptidase regulatory-like domain
MVAPANLIVKNPGDIKIMKKSIAVVLLFGSMLFFAAAASAQGKEKKTSFTGTVTRSDRNQPVSGVRIVLLDDKKSEGKSNSVETTTDNDGNFSFENVTPGKYTLSIAATFDRQEDVPCTLLLGKIAEPNSSVLVVTDKEGKHTEQIFVKGFTIKKDKETKRSFDLVCKSMFGG